MAKTVEGLKLSITSQQLKALCQQRVEYHTNRAEFCAKKAEREKEDSAELDQLADQAVEQMKYANSMPLMSRATTWTQQAKHHTDRATVFKFMAGHLVQNASYILGEDDLRKLEVLPQW